MYLLNIKHIVDYDSLCSVVIYKGIEAYISVLREDIICYITELLVNLYVYL